MITIRHSDNRGTSHLGWLDSKHTFSFGEYRDRAHMGFSVLRVLNEDHVIGGAGFSEHGHENMEIISYVLSGALAHKDSLGNGSIIEPFDVQIMSAGNGVRHSEFNESPHEDVHFLQIWIKPNVRDAEPTYQQESLVMERLHNQLSPIITPDGRDNSLMIRQDVTLFNGVFDSDLSFTHESDRNRSYWLQLAKGEVSVNGARMQAGDGAAISEEEMLNFDVQEESNILLFDLPAA